jgi:hypothetical protein
MSGGRVWLNNCDECDRYLYVSLVLMQDGSYRYLCASCLKTVPGVAPRPQIVEASRDPLPEDEDA